MEFLNQRKLSFRFDRSNADLFYLRNWIRLKLMPELVERFGAELPARLCAQTEVLRDEEAYLADFDSAGVEQSKQREKSQPGGLSQ